MIVLFADSGAQLAVGETARYLSSFGFISLLGIERPSMMRRSMSNVQSVSNMGTNLITGFPYAGAPSLDHHPSGTLSITLERSSGLRAGLLLLHVGGVLLLLVGDVPFAVLVAGLGLALGSLVHCWKRHVVVCTASVVGVELDDNARCVIHTANGIAAYGTLDAAYASPLFTVLHVRSEVGVRSVLVCADAVDAGTYRALRVQVRVAVPAQAGQR